LAHSPESDESVAPVITLNTRRRLLPPAPADAPGDERSAEFWRSAFAEHGLTLDSSAPVDDVLKIVAERLEAVVTGLLYLREGGGPRELAPDPEVGIDYRGALEVVGLLRELKAAPAVARRLSGNE
jgi:hypothetical protein